jgi:hypothetical protein
VSFVGKRCTGGARRFRLICTCNRVLPFRRGRRGSADHAGVTTYAYDTSTNHLVAVWDTGIGATARTVARLHARTG